MKRISMTYGQVLFELGMKKESLQKAQDMLHENKELLSALENPTITKKEKENVVDKLFSDDLKSFLKVVCDNDDIDCFDEAVEYYDELKRKTDKIIKAEFDYVTMPKDEQLERIKQYLMKQYQADKVDLTLKEDADLIGGFVLKVGDHVYDNSLKGKMRKLHQKLTWR
jgi:F-type H+-transporting ATPase subunit delta